MVLGVYSSSIGCVSVSRGWYYMGRSKQWQRENKGISQGKYFVQREGKNSPVALRDVEGNGAELTLEGDNL